MAEDWNQRIIEAFRANGGEVEQFGRSLVLVHHVGARTGTERVSPVMGFPTDAGWLVVASKAGAPEHPAWYRNLLANPSTTLEAPDEGEVAVQVRELDPDERAVAWRRITSEAPGFADYEKRTDRVIPVLELTRR
ncbi:nitroreductase family deazaflavin-dependent oxidoreductase [Aquipuribacter sp. SD81]|uniref:nitroreductase family deazaflavin-dependent oxidoreductase n=1 Tax=Aquipuribacter sp. SD81 TaxID=3127703 RepID=UPI003016E150